MICHVAVNDLVLNMDGEAVTESVNHPLAFREGLSFGDLNPTRCGRSSLEEYPDLEP